MSYSASHCPTSTLLQLRSEITNYWCCGIIYSDMKSEDPGNTGSSHTARISFKRQLLEKCGVTMLALFLAGNFIHYTLGDLIPGRANNHPILTFLILFSVQWLFDYLYRRYRGV
ncbi:hypothetical protein BDW42DRAFT_158784 [Aspergillus taichungensis]|uniref:Uncharacterized protein n=1 Tax=Aspergillus taichungensis TaxID=482145 RepID=A0A2J5I9F3_9EURO|nr:hypothetical protein BDW42DRAFT_158784 [Aspergillus taichungensis]